MRSHCAAGGKSPFMYAICKYDSLLAAKSVRGFSRRNVLIYTTEEETKDLTGLRFDFVNLEVFMQSVYNSKRETG